ncbi:efflux RND transporter periplasmic adaptor subunit [Maribellus sp. YY47]|uniref:efflux RND transporter periplasmic adaptor subunit n=1 Tax=Maribellus sp. YY47 TaxID=2929486 RepID=UPI0020019F58|nr:efflux RND transporter periplasmic adaptor subunit [Maribellus sp. YY47]MCK3686418.1 efflux RND transporter periplasmic adaptor subunit [Maribellus sp. YY47]
MKTTRQIRNLSILASFFAAYSCSNAPQGPSGMAGQVKQLKVMELSTSDVTLHQDFPTTLQGEQTVEIRPRVAGYIESILVDEGDYVKKGQTLFKINANDIEAQVRSADAQVKVAESMVTTAKINVEKTKPLVEKNIISGFELESVENNLKSAEAQLAQAKANLANAKANLQYTVITSPTNGLIGNFPYRVGSLVSSSIAQPLTTVSNTSSMQAYFSMNEKDFLQLTKDLEGSNTREKLEKLPEVELILPDNSVYATKGTIETASGIVDQLTGAVNIRASFPNPTGDLRSGGSGRVRLPEMHKSVITVPQKATFEIQGSHFVYVVNAENKVVMTPIQTVAGNLKEKYVVTSGLKSGDKIVIEGVSTLRDGIEIKPVLDNQQATVSNN